MGVLQTAEGRTVTLRRRTLVGRSPNCDLGLDDKSVSSEHAVVRWGRDGWLIRDLASRNGTFVDGRRSPPGRDRPLPPGATIVFGECGPWRLASAAPPRPEAHPLERGEVLLGDAETLLLPANEAVACVYAAPDRGWLLERDGVSEPIADGAVVAIDGRSWRLHLPDPSADRLDSTADRSPAPLTVATMRLRFRVSADEECVRLWATWPHRELDLGERAHHYTLLTLARFRAGSTLPEPERGWIARTELARQLRIAPPTVNLHLFRARQQLDAEGVDGVGGLFELREATHEVRIAVPGDRLDLGQ